MPRCFRAPTLLAVPKQVWLLSEAPGVGSVSLAPRAAIWKAGRPTTCFSCWGGGSVFVIKTRLPLDSDLQQLLKGEKCAKSDLQGEEKIGLRPFSAYSKHWEDQDKVSLLSEIIK